MSKEQSNENTEAAVFLRKLANELDAGSTRLVGWNNAESVMDESTGGHYRKYRMTGERELTLIIEKRGE
jgi:hypothetical protein